MQKLESDKLKLQPLNGVLANGSYSMSWVIAFWNFCRPHTIIGTNLQILTGYILAHKLNPDADINSWVSYALLWFSAMSLNLYVVGLNQLTDIEIDRINKPTLPLASERFSRSTGRIIVAASGVFAVFSAFALSSYFLVAVLGILMIGTLYSLPPVHLKTHPVGAALGIATARGLLFNLGVFLHFNHAMGHHLVLPFYVLSLAIFIFGFCIVIAIMKDIPDIDGDRKYQVQTLAVRMGPRVAFKFSLAILSVCYIVFIAGGFFDIFPAHSLILGFSHLLVLFLMLGMALKVSPEDKEEVYSYYMLLWKMFYLEFFIFIFIFGVLP